MKLGIVHVPKCAGLSLRSVLDDWDEVYTGSIYFDPMLLGGAELRHATRASIRQVANLRRLRKIVTRHRAVIGHFGVEFLLEAGVDQVIVLVREPRSQLLSLFDYWSGLGDDLELWGDRGRRIREATSGTLSTFLESPLVVADRHSDIARYFLPGSMRVKGRDGSWMLAPEIAEGRRPELVEEALGRLRGKLHRVYWSHELPEIVDHVRRTVGRSLRGPNDSVPVLNGVDEGHSHREIGPLELRLLKENTILSDHVLNWLMQENLLSRRSGVELDDEFRINAERHGFSFADAEGA